jgi:hypothetical protein
MRARHAISPQRRPTPPRLSTHLPASQEPSVLSGPVTLPVDRRTMARLHGHACVTCGATDAPLTPAGYAHTIAGDGGLLGWPVRACPHHKEHPA